MRQGAHKHCMSCNLYLCEPLWLITSSRVDSMISQYTALYSTTWGKTPYANLSGLATALDWTDIIGQSTASYLDSQGIDRKWTNEMVEGATRVNYGQVRSKPPLQIANLTPSSRMLTTSTR